jgi:hypothetical protein
MDTSSSDPIGPNAELFDQYVLERLQRSLLKVIFENYRSSSRYCWRNFQPPQAKDLSGAYRRARIEEEWAGIGVGPWAETTS